MTSYLEEMNSAANAINLKKNQIAILLSVNHNPKKNEDFFILKTKKHDNKRITTENLKIAIVNKFKIQDTINIEIQNNGEVLENGQSISFIKNTRVISSLMNIYFSHDRFPKIHNTPRLYQFSGDMVKHLLNYKRKNGIVQPYHIQAAYDCEKRKISFNGTKRHRFDLPSLPSLHITFKTRINDGNMNISSSLTDVQAVYDGIRDSLNLDDNVPMQISYMKDGKLYHNYQGGKLNNEDLDEEDLKDGKFHILNITFPQIHGTVTKDFINKILEYKSKNINKITNKTLQKLYNSDFKFVNIEKELTSNYGATLKVKIPFKQGSTTIGDIENAIQKNLNLTSDIAVYLLYAGKVENIKTRIVSQKDYIFEHCVMKLNNVFLSQDLCSYIQNYRKNFPNKKINSQMLQNFSNAVNNTTKITPNAPTISTLDYMFDYVKAITNSISLDNNNYLNITSLQDFYNLMQESSFLLSTIINSVPDKNNFLEWYMQSFGNDQLMRDIFILYYPYDLSELYGRDILPYTIEHSLQEITRAYPFFLAQRNAIAEILSNYEQWFNVLQTDSYRSLNGYLYQNFGKYINFRYYQLYVQQTGIQTPCNYEQNYQTLYYQLYQMTEPTAPSLIDDNSRITNNTDQSVIITKMKNYDLKFKVTNKESKIITVELLSYLFKDGDESISRDDIIEKMKQEYQLSGTSKIELKVKNQFNQEIILRLIPMQKNIRNNEDFTFELIVDGQNYFNETENFQKKQSFELSDKETKILDEMETQKNDQNNTKKTKWDLKPIRIVKYIATGITTISFVYFMLYKFGLAPNVKNITEVKKLFAWQ